MVTSSHSCGGGASVASTFATTFASLRSIREALGRPHSRSAPYRRGRRGYPLLVVLLEAGHALDGGGCVELLVRDILRLLGEAGRREDVAQRSNQSYTCTSA
jgi:hypothetical protein